MTNDTKLAALIVICAGMFCGTLITMKNIDFKIITTQETTKRMISYDQRCIQSDSCEPISSKLNRK